MMNSLQYLLLQKKNVKIDAVENRIRYDSHICDTYITLFEFCRCFPHIVNLACKATLNAITDLKYAEDAQRLEYIPGYVRKDCIATVRSLTNAVSSLPSFSPPV
jgi:hypothetical protein